MIKSDVIHPQILGALARAGHKARILISDANYSFVTNSAPGAEIVYLNFVPGTVPSADILAGVCKLINVEHASMMAWPDDFENTVHKDYVEILPADTPLDLVSREEFYASAKSPDTLLVIASGETRRFANILLTVGPVFL
ncbi:RbsD/FucU domain-containing protein [Aliiruegeria sabulilitoris]|uniref:RbsD/FucU domain-containing protein n=1 Tax=Aliiruegeria sabulilitoris TaxID=1510458 RepID=UPI000831FB3E|nr:RbsD/FucU domain-containing protein [Aliiruegeria sabulilitoris]NDR58497.1 RbsD/FucU transporter [Pseudoruegeria sp. M32A2M]